MLILLFYHFFLKIQVFFDSISAKCIRFSYNAKSSLQRSLLLFGKEVFEEIVGNYIVMIIHFSLPVNNLFHGIM